MKSINLCSMAKGISQTFILATLALCFPLFAQGIGTSYSYTAGGATSNLGYSIHQYQFDWKADGADPSPWGSATQSKTWTTASNYDVRTTARWVTDTSVASSWSGSLSANISLSYPTANFKADVTSGPLPLTVHFTDLSSGDVNQWKWDLNGDGNIDSFEQNPTFTYDRQGKYTVSLYVSGPFGEDRKVIEDYIEVYLPPGTPGTIKWQYKVGGESGRGVESSPAIDAQGNIYIGSDDYYVYSFTANGELRWRYQTGMGSQSIFIMGSPSIFNDTVYIPSMDGYLYALSTNGVLKWKRLLEEGGSSGGVPTIGSDGTIYIASWSIDKTKLHSINPDGTEKWTRSSLSVFYNPVVGSDDTIYTYTDKPESMPSSLVAFNVDGTQMWESELPGGCNGGGIPAMDERHIYVSNYCGIYAINYGGYIEWVAKEEIGCYDWHQRPPCYQTIPRVTSVVVGDGIIYLTSGGNLYAVSSADGIAQWKFGPSITYAAIIGAPCIGSDGVIYVMCGGVGGGQEPPGLYAVNANGTEIWHADLGYMLYSSSPVIKNNTLYVGSNNGNIYAFNVASNSLAPTPWPVLHKNQFHTGRWDGAQILPPNYVVTTNPSGLHIIVDGTSYICPQTFSWPPGSNHSVEAISPQDGETGSRFVYTSWSDGGTQTHTVTAPSSSTTYTANFTTQYSLTTSVNPPEGGTANPSGTNWYDGGQNVSVSATANPGFAFSNWSGDLSGSTNPASISMDRPMNVTANFIQNQYTLTININSPGSGSVTKNPDKARYAHGEQVTLTATANAGYAFHEWSGDLSGTANPTSINMNGPKNVVANFTQNQYTLTVSITPSGSGSVAKNPDKASYVYGDVVTLTATANAGYTFSNWSGDATGSTNPVTVTIDGNKNVTANFTQNQYTLTVNIAASGSGSVTKSPNKPFYIYGEQVQLTAMANPGYTFNNWSGDATGSTNPVTVTISGNKNLTANFIQNQYTVTVNINPIGAGSVNKSPDKITYVYGDTVKLTATANPGYTFSNWSNDVTGSTNPVTVTINGNKNVTANFTQNQYTVTISITPSGSGSVTKSPNKASYTYGEQITLTATANPGYTFDKWSGDVSGATNPITVTVNGNKTATANFIKIPETVSTPTTPSGPSSGTIGALYSYTTGGSTSSYDHPVEYQFDWKGNGSDLSPWGAATQSKIWTAAGTYKVKARARCTLDTSVISGWSGSIKVVIALNRSTRTLPHSYTPSLPLTVAIAINPSATTQAYSAEDSPPSGWTVSNINEYGQWDDVNKKVKWGIFFDSNFRTLTYQVTPPIGETPVKSFSGQASFEGVNEVIGGDSMIELGALLHPADTSLNFELSISEVTAYAAAWRSGQTWPVPPNPIPIEYPTNAGYLWRNGEEYHYDATRIPPSCWVPGAATEGLSVKRSLPLKNQVSFESQVALNAGAATRDLPNCYTPSVVMPVSITVAPGQGTQAYAVEDSLPAGWTVSDTDENGGWDNVKKKVKWGPFFDANNRTLTYKAAPPVGETGTGTKTFSGTASFDGTNVTIGGDLTVGDCSTGPITPQSPSDNISFDTCSLYSLPTFSWTAAETFRSYEIQFSRDESFSSTPVKIKVPGTARQLTMTLNAWKRVLLIPGGAEGSVYWRIVGTRANRKTATSEVCSIIIEATQPVEGQTISPTSITSLPTLSWGNNCNTKFKVWFESDEQFSKKKAFVFNIKNPDDNEGEFTKVLTSGQWMAIRRVVGDTAGSTIYWYIESWDGLGRYSKTDGMNFVLTD